MENVVIATIKSWNIKEALLFRRRYSEKYNVFIITKKEELTYDRIAELNRSTYFSLIGPGLFQKKFTRISSVLFFI